MCFLHACIPTVTFGRSVPLSCAAPVVGAACSCVSVMLLKSLLEGAGDLVSWL